MPENPVVKNSALTRSQLDRLVGEVIEEARRLGASAAEAAVSIESGLSVNVRMGEVETIEHNHDKGMGVTVYFGHAKGSASTTDFAPQALRDAVAAACRVAKYTAEDEFAGLAEPDTLATDCPDLDLNHPWELAPERAIELALECENAARAFDARIVNSEGAGVATHQAFRVYGNSHGFVGAYGGTHHSLSCAVVGKEGDSMQRDYWYTASRLPAELESPQQVGRLAAERTVKRLGARKLSTRQAPVLFTADVAGSLIGGFLGAIRGGEQYRRASFLLDSLGQTVFPEFVHLCERPRLPRGYKSASFDREGVATHDRDLVRDGKVMSYVLDSYSARRLGLVSTGNAGGVRNVFVETGDLDFAALLREMHTGLVVTEMIGQGLNMVTGDYSRGAAGFWVENGEVQYPVEEITVAGNMRDMLKNIVAIGNDVDHRGNIHTGSVLLSEIAIAGD